MYDENEYLLLSGIQHFEFCRRQWALIHIEQQWEENYRTADGSVMHRNVHDAGFHEKRGNVVISRAMAVSSARLGISGECDAVEFRKDASGIDIYGLDGRYIVIPVEYKRGEPKENDSDKMQLCAQAMCLEEMLCCEIDTGYLYYGESRHRMKVEISAELREKTENALKEMHELFRRRYTPKVRRSKACNACSLKNICLPVLCSGRSAKEHMLSMIKEE